MNVNFLAVYDFETGGKNANTAQVTQLAAAILDPRSFEIVSGGVFNSEVNPIWDIEKCKELGVAPVEQEALDKTHKTRAQLEKCPDISTVWKDYVNFLSRYNVRSGNDTWGKPIPGGFNINGYDSKIIDRLCREYGPYDDVYNTQKVYHPIYSYDLMDDIWRWTDSIKINDRNSKSLDSVREWLGMSKEGAHDGLNDVLDCCELIKRFMGRYREFFKKTKFEGALANWKRPKIGV